jgi:hypothetical protein
MDTREATFIKNLMREVLEEVGLIQPFITRQEIITQVGRHRYEKAVKSGIINRNKLKGKNSQVRVSRKEFTAMLKNGAI